MDKPDLINKPPHYTRGRIETIDVIEDWGLGFHLGNVVKYISRCELKGSKVDDLKKAHWYLARAIEIAERGEPFPDAAEWAGDEGKTVALPRAVKK